MYLDSPSFFAAIVILSPMNAIMMMIGWLEDRRVAAFAFWAGAHLASSSGGQGGLVPGEAAERVRFDCGAK